MTDEDGVDALLDLMRVGFLLRHGFDEGFELKSTSTACLSSSALKMTHIRLQSPISLDDIGIDAFADLELGNYRGQTIFGFRNRHILVLHKSQRAAGFIPWRCGLQAVD